MNAIVLTLLGITLPVWMSVIVKLLEYTGLLKNGDHKRAAVLAVSALLALVGVALNMFPQIQPVVDAVFLFLYNVIIGTLGYTAFQDATEKDKDK